MQKSPSYEANNHSTSHKIVCISRNLTVHYHVYKSSLLVLNFSQINLSTPSHIISLQSILTLSWHLCFGIPSGLFLFRFWQEFYIPLSSLSHVLHAPSISSSLIWSL